MSRDLDDLVPEFRPKVDQLLAACEAAGVRMRPYFTLRTPAEQAKLWRQSRTLEEINAAIADLQGSGADYLATILGGEGPMEGKRVTDALPGFSWHQWGEAVDCFWLLNGNAEWSTRRTITLSDGRAVNGYKLYGEMARSMGLTSGGFWSSFKDWPHVQLRPESSPKRTLTLAAINAAMKERFA